MRSLCPRAREAPGKVDPEAAAVIKGIPPEASAAAIVVSNLFEPTSGLMKLFHQATGAPPISKSIILCASL